MKDAKLVRATELDLVADGYAQLAWAASFVSLRCAKRIAIKSEDFRLRAWALRTPWFDTVMATVAMGVGSWAFLGRLSK